MQREDLEDILERAQASNAASGITGALVYVDECFLQVLEGSAEAVQTLMAKISTDLRHETVTVLQAQAVPARCFADWQMAYVSATAAQVAEWAGLNVRTDLPDTLDSMRVDRERALQAMDGILAVLMQQRASRTGAG
ncbi:MAG: BLUF domain-containing protein [Burkholderiales bacterium]|nr:BLUF domain-containing protein [Burkholderiales bacterium]